MHLTFRGVFLSLIQKHFPSTKRKREKGTGIKRKRKSSLTPSPAPASCPAAPATATQLLCLLPFSPLDAFCCFPAHLPLLPHPEDSSSGSSPLFLSLPHCPCRAPPSPRPTLGADGTRPSWCLSPSCSKGGPPQPLTQSMAGVLGKKNNISLPNYLLWLRVRRVLGFLLQWDVEQGEEGAAALAGCGAACAS